MLFQIHLSKGASYPLESYFVESDSKENAISYLYFTKLLNIDKYKIILVVDMSKQILKDDLNLNLLEAEVDNKPDSNTLDHVLKYTDIFNKPVFKLSEQTCLSWFDAIKLGIVNTSKLLEHYTEKVLK